jgi:hypothetical protein
MADEVDHVERFWTDRQAALATRAAALQAADLPDAVTAARQRQADLGAARQGAAAARVAVAAARAALAGVTMPADTGALEAAWEVARLDLAQAETDVVARTRGLAEAQATILRLQAEAADLAAAIAEAGTAAKAAAEQAQRLQALKARLQEADFAIAQGQAAALLTEGNTARATIDRLLPDRIAGVLNARARRDQTLQAQLTSPADAAQPATTRSAQALADFVQSAEAMTAGAGVLVAEAQRLFAQWNTLAVAGPGSPVSRDRRDLLDARARSHRAGLIALADLEGKLAALEAAEMARAAKARDWPPPGVPGHTADGPDLTAETAAVTAALAAYAPRDPAQEPALWAARVALVQVPDEWVDLSRRHHDLMRRLDALGAPLGAASVAAAVTALSAAVEAHATELEKAADSRDIAAARARRVDESRAHAQALVQISDARLALVPGGIMTLT